MRFSNIFLAFCAILSIICVVGSSLPGCITVHSAMESHGDEEDNMQTIYRAAQVIMKSIANFTKATKGTNAIEVTSDIHDVPAELYAAIP